MEGKNKHHFVTECHKMAGSNYLNGLNTETENVLIKVSRTAQTHKLPTILIIICSLIHFLFLKSPETETC